MTEKSYTNNKIIVKKYQDNDTNDYKSNNIVKFDKKNRAFIVFFFIQNIDSKQILNLFSYLEYLCKKNHLTISYVLKKKFTNEEKNELTDLSINNNNNFNEKEETFYYNSIVFSLKDNLAIFKDEKKFYSDIRKMINFSKENIFIQNSTFLKNIFNRDKKRNTFFHVTPSKQHFKKEYNIIHNLENSIYSEYIHFKKKYKISFKKKYKISISNNKKKQKYNILNSFLFVSFFVLTLLLGVIFYKKNYFPFLFSNEKETNEKKFVDLNTNEFVDLIEKVVTTNKTIGNNIDEIIVKFKNGNKKTIGKTHGAMELINIPQSHL